MQHFIENLSFLHKCLGWASLACLVFMVVMKKGTRAHRVTGDVTIWVLGAMALLAASFVTYRLFGGQFGKPGFAIIGVNTLALPLYYLITAKLFANRAWPMARKVAWKTRVWWLLAGFLVYGTAASILSGAFPYRTGYWIFSIEMNGLELIVAGLLPVATLMVDRNWKFSDFDRKGQIDQHVLRTVAGTVFMIYAAAPWNHLTNWVYVQLFGPLWFGHILLYTGSPFLAMFVIYQFMPQVRRGLARLRGLYPAAISAELAK